MYSSRNLILYNTEDEWQGYQSHPVKPNLESIQYLAWYAQLTVVLGHCHERISLGAGNSKHCLKKGCFLVSVLAIERVTQPNPSGGILIRIWSEHRGFNSPTTPPQQQVAWGIVDACLSKYTPYNRHDIGGIFLTIGLVRWRERAGKSNMNEQGAKSCSLAVPVCVWRHRSNTLSRCDCALEKCSIPPFVLYSTRLLFQQNIKALTFKEDPLDRSAIFQRVELCSELL